jgi:hypothetical protein
MLVVTIWPLARTALPAALSRELHRCQRKGIREDIAPRPQRLEIRIGKMSARAVRPCGARQDCDEASGILHRQRAEEHGIEDAEERHVQTDPQGERADHDEGEQRVLEDGADGVA